MFFHPHDREEREHEDARARAEISDVDRDDELQHRGHDRRASDLDDVAQSIAEREEERRRAEQERDDDDERLLGRLQEKQRARDRSDEGHREERRELLPHVAIPKLAAICEGGCDGARPERHRVRRVCGDGVHPREEQRGEREEASASGDGVHPARDERSEK